MVLAMAQYQLNHVSDARASLAKGVEVEQTKLPKLESGDIGGKFGDSWTDWIIAHALLDQAKAMIQHSPTTPKE